MSFIGAISDLDTGTYTVTRRAPNTIVDGRVVAGSTSTFTIDAQVTPITGKDLMSLPEAFHEKSVYRVITATALQTRTSASGEADRISIAGVLHKVFKAQFWETPDNERFYDAMAVAEPA